MDDSAKIKQEILKMTIEQVDRLSAMWKHMFDPSTCEAFLHKLNDHARNFYTDLMNESNEKQQVIEGEIDALRDEAANITRLLNKSVDIGEKPADMPLVIWQMKLDESLVNLREELNARRREICELLLQQEQLCEDLGEPPLPLLADPLPMPEEFKVFNDHLNRLRELREERLEDLFELRTQIKQDMKLLELLPQTNADEHLLNSSNFKLTPDTLAALRKMQKCYADQVAQMRTSIDDMRNKINVLWDRLQETDEYGMRQVRESKEYTQRTYDMLSAELQRCQALRRQNLKTFIEQLRVEIKDMWDLTLKSQQERKRFSNYYNDWYNEDLLELHELELDDLKTYYNDNKEIFELYARRAELWSRMEALEAKANEPNRYNNRGGQLLKEERERKAITSKLPKIEQQITELVQKYMDRAHTPFLVHGENILERMADDWTRRRQAKEQQSSARKHVGMPTSAGKMLPPPAPGSAAARTPIPLKNMSAMSSSTMSLRKTPSQQQLTTTMNAAGAKTTGNLHKRKFPNSNEGANQAQTPNAKRSLLTALNSLKPSTIGLRKASQHLSAVHNKSVKSPLKKVRVLANTLRRSSGLNRRSINNAGKKTRPKLPTPQLRVQPATSDESDYVTDENNAGGGGGGGGDDADDTYDSFKKSIEPAARSSVLPTGCGRPTRQLVRNTPIRKRAAPSGNINNNNNNEPANNPTRLAMLPKPRRLAGNSSTVNNAAVSMSPLGSNRKLAAVTKDLPILI